MIIEEDLIEFVYRKPLIRIRMNDEITIDLNHLIENTIVNGGFTWHPSTINIDVDWSTITYHTTATSCGTMKIG